MRSRIVQTVEISERAEMMFGSCDAAMSSMRCLCFKAPSSRSSYSLRWLSCNLKFVVSCPSRARIWRSDSSRKCSVSRRIVVISASSRALTSSCSQLRFSVSLMRTFSAPARRLLFEMAEEAAQQALGRSLVLSSLPRPRSHPRDSCLLRPQSWNLAQLPVPIVQRVRWY